MRNKKGFTLIEVLVTLVILALLAAIAIPTASHYIKLAEFRKNEANAKTAYLAAESTLTWYRSSGEWEEFRREIIQKGTPNRTFGNSEADTEKNNRIYAVTLNGGRSGTESGSQDLARLLLEDSAYSEDFLSGSIAIEIDIETGQVYSAFYGTRCQELSYTGTDKNGVLNISAADGNRSYENRRERLLGYYSVEDLANVVELKPIRLKVTSVNLVNSETLSLNWSSNSRHNNLDIDFIITFYSKEDEAELFSAKINRSALLEQGWTGGQTARLNLTDSQGKSLGLWDFPLNYQEGGSDQNGRFSLILDAMMSASLQESLLAAGEGASNPLAPTSSTSITRLGEQIPSLKKPLDIYAVVQAEADYSRMTGDFREYRESRPVTSNTENSLFALGSKETNGEITADIARFRHLSNIRFADPDKEGVFTLTGRNMDWRAAGTGYYDAQTAGADGQVRLLQWRGNLPGTGALDFPSLPLLAGNHTLAGSASGSCLSNLHLGKESVPEDTVMEGIYPGGGIYSRYLGLFCEAEGTIRNITLQNPVLNLAGPEDEPVSGFGHLSGIGMLCGRSQGILEDISVTVTEKDIKTLNIRLANRETGAWRDTGPAAIGGLVGVFAEEGEDGTLLPLTDSGKTRIRNLSVEGFLTAFLPVPAKASKDTEPEETAETYAYGIGGVFGYARIGGTVKIEDCINHAQVTGNLFTGGIGGRVTGDYTGPASVNDSGLLNCENDGLVLCHKEAAREEEERELGGRYFGGILGYGSHVRILTSLSASGRLAGYRYTADQKEEVLLGQYVGGIIGYGNVCRLTGCSTQNGGYILGSDYVGGIAGGLSNDIRYAITGETEVSVTANASYVIGNSYVGGIVGKNDGFASSTVQNCVNNGVAAGYGRYIGGIVGYNGANGVLLNCASYLSDYDHSIYNTIVKEWQVTGDCVGGLAGYNSGTLRFDAQGAATSVRSVASIVTGRNFVGGIVGFNDRTGKLDVNYELIGGQIYASGIGAGGAVGLNASADLLTKDFSLRPVSVEGNLGVGGCIGVSLVDLSGDTQMDGFRANNSLGSIKGNAFTGGIIGYHRTYASAQLGGVSLADYLWTEMEGTAPQGRGALLPKLDEENLPTPVMKSGNTFRLIIGNKDNSKDRLDSSNNNIPIQGFLYTGGIVGGCERTSRLVLKNCRNSGSISKPAFTGGSLAARGVSLKAYLNREGMSSGADEIEDIRVYMAGGVIGVNMEHQVIDHCVNTGSMRDFAGLGGIVGFNAGGIFGCELADNFGNAGLNYIGGIAGLNIRAGNAALTYTDVNSKRWNYGSGTIGGCSTLAGRTVSGRSFVGGIAGFNLPGGFLTENVNLADVTAAGDYAGGIAGVNAGNMETTADTSVSSRTVTGNNGRGIGGLAGWNKTTGTITVKSGQSTAAEVIAVGERVSVSGRERVGGIVGFNEGKLTASGSNQYLTAKAKEVRALSGYAGGIAGEASGAAGEILRARNRCAYVTANTGPAGGIVALVSPGMRLEDCENLGNVNSDDGYAGGIAALNSGTIKGCRSGKDGEPAATVSSHGVHEIGGVCAVNQKEGIISDSASASGLTLSGNGEKAGGIAGANEGIIQNTESGTLLSSMPRISLRGSSFCVGGAAGTNRNGGVIRNICTDGLSFEKFTNFQYLGGIAGENQKGALVENCLFANGTIQEGRSQAGNCYGGIAGNNEGTLRGCSVSRLTMTVTGVYTATSTSTALEKEEKASHAGGIAGKNSREALIDGCFLADTSAEGPSVITAGSGMAGGIAGFNKGRITLSGDESTETLMKNVKEPSDGTFRESAKTLRENAGNLSADVSYVNWNNGTSLENHTYNGSGRTVSQGRSLTLTVSTNGNLGGITAYNAASGQLDRCSTGSWYLNNQSAAIGVGTGGIVGMNESEKDLSFLVNRAFVGRQLAAADTNRFAGGIIGNQNNTTLEGWKIRGCLNYGTVYCLNTHYSGGILGQWTGTGGTVETCYNYGNLQTTYAAGWVGAAGGIVAQLYHAYENNEYNIISCGNYGNIYGRNGRSYNDCANDSAGILGNVTAFRADTPSAGQKYTIQVLDCVNGSGVEIYSGSMASGIVGFFSCDNPGGTPIVNSTGNITLRIERCRNFAAVLQGVQYVGGILGDRYGQSGSANTFLKDCYSVNRGSGSYNKTDNPVVSYQSGSSIASAIQAGWNYFLQEGGTGFSGSATPAGATASQRRAAASRAYLVTADDGNRYLAYLNPGKRTDSGRWKLENDHLMYNGTDTGQVLFRLDKFTKTGTMAEITEKGSLFDEDVRKAYHKIEDGANLIQSGIYPEETKMKKPELPKDGTAPLTVTGRQAAIHLAETDVDPFCYKAVLYAGSNELRTLVFYDKDYTFTLTAMEAALLKNNSLKVSVCACSMFDEVEDSDYIKLESGQIVKILPDPRIRAELVRNGNTYAYRFRLENPEDYKDYGTAGWHVSIKLMDGTTQANRTELTITPGQTVTVPYTALTADSLQQLLVQAVSTAADTLSSGQVSVPVYLPRYTPSLAVKTDRNVKTAVPGITISGTCLEDLSITVTLDAKDSGSITTTPIYRAELVGTWNAGENDEQKEAVLAGTDILTSAGGSVSAVFSDFPDYLETYASHVSSLQIRIWYAQSGLGPVYTYYPEEKAKANVCILKEITARTENGTEVPEPVWEYLYSPVLDGNGLNLYRAYLPEGGNLFTWLPRPNLAQEAELKTDTGSTGDRLEYTFRWDQEAGEYTPGNTYAVSLTGIRGENRVSLVTDREIAGNSLAVDAEDWSYDRVELTVTRKGDVSQGTLGLTASRVYPVKQRLPRPAQPAVANPDTDELNYTIEWTPVVPEDGCGSYRIYLQAYLPDNTLDTPVEISDEDIPVTGKDEDGLYRQTLNLENYNGSKVRIFVVAKAQENSTQYADSINGVAYELEIPRRIDAPTVTWEKTWEYDRANPVPAESFLAEDETKSGGLNVRVHPDADSIPPGDSSLLLKAYVFENREAAEDARLELEKGTDPGTIPGLLALYPVPALSGLTPAAMVMENSQSYLHTLRRLSAEYAGKWILFYTRISSGNGQVSSKWTVNPDTWRLPYVKLEKPKLSSGSREMDIAATNNLNPDLPLQETWKGDCKEIRWQNVTLADCYYLTLTPRDGTVSPLQYKITETAKEDNGQTYLETRVYRKVRGSDGQESWAEIPAGETGGIRTFEMTDYSMEVSGTYLRSGLSVPYTVEANARLETLWDPDAGLTYTLTLPDIDSLRPAADITVTDAALRPTASVKIYADVAENDPGNPAKTSDAYVESDPSSVDLGN